MRIQKLFIILVFSCFIITSCRKPQKEMMVSTGTTPNIISSNSATVTGKIVDLGEGVTQYGHCYGKTQGVDISDLRTNHGAASKTGEFQSELKDLETNTKYYVRAYIGNGKDIVYGDVIEFTTPSPMPPPVSTSNISNITQTTASSGGNVTSDGGAPVTSRGVCWNTTGNPTIGNSKTSDGSGTGSFTSSITGLQPCVIYHVRAYAINSAGTAYGNEISFTTAGNIPTVTTAAVTGITRTTAISGGNISSDGCASITTRGVCWGTSANPTIAGSHTTNGSGTGSFTSSITGLTSNTNYYVRAYATHNQGTTYGNQVQFITLAISVPALTTNAVTSVAPTTAVSGGNITDDGGGTITARGVCWSTSANPTISNSHTTNGTGTGSFTSNITGLTSGTTYYVRAYATNSAGTAYGNQRSFITPVTDIEGNVYKTVVIGTQVWMAENLKTTKYNDGITIPHITDNATWASITTPGYCWYNNDAATYKATYGALYNWYTVNTGKLCPSGWHIPNDSEWTILTDYLGGLSVAGGKMKEAGFTHWISPNTGATNESGFTALPGGYHSYLGNFDGIGVYGDFWSSSEYNLSNAWCRDMGSAYSNVYRANYSKKDGFSVRCLKD